MDIFKNKVLQLLPILGTPLFSKSTAGPSNKEQKLICKIKGLVAYGNRTDSGFVVYKGSQAVLEHSQSSIRHRKRRVDLTEKGVLVLDKDCNVFSRDYEFTSPSLASATICGGATNGLTKWKNNQGKTLKEIEME